MIPAHRSDPLSIYRERRGHAESLPMAVSDRLQSTISSGCFHPSVGHHEQVIIRDLATLSIWREQRTAREIADALQLAPTKSHEKGDPTRAARRGNVRPGRSAVETDARWSLDGDADASDPDDETGFRTLRQLVRRVSDKAVTIAELKRDCDVSITWSGFSDSWQGGFVLEADLPAELGRLGIPIWGTAYLEGDSDSESEDGWTSSRSGFIRAWDAAKRRLLAERLGRDDPPAS